MSKKNNSFGKFLAFTTAVAAVGGACYIYRDRIKESKLYKKSADKFSNLFHKVTDKFSDEDDFIFDDEFEDDFSDDVFSDEAKSNREYTSITINSKADSPSEDTTESEDGIPTISYDEKQTNKEESTNTDNTEETSDETEKVTTYENEGLSDVSEDPDVLEDQDKLDY